MIRKSTMTTDEPWIRRVAVTRGSLKRWREGPEGNERGLTGLYVGEVCSHGTCDRPPEHEGRCSSFDGPAPTDAVIPHPVGAKAGDIDWPATVVAFGRVHGLLKSGELSSAELATVSIETLRCAYGQLLLHHVAESTLLANMLLARPADVRVLELDEVLNAWNSVLATPFMDETGSTCSWSAAYHRFERLLNASVARRAGRESSSEGAKSSSETK